MASKKQTITIDSILGGISPFTHFSAADQFRACLGINPSGARTDSLTATSTRGSGLLRPTPSQKLSGTTITDTPMWILGNPKIEKVFIYDHSGSVYTTIDTAPFTLTALSDGGSMTGSKGDGAAYYDNYMYFAKETTVARYGPLNGTPGFDGDYWVTTLGKAALTSDSGYPSHAQTGDFYPRHVLHRHSNGNLYIADVINGEGVLHYISTTKTSVEGDTNNGSTYDKVGFGYGFYPTAICSFGDYLLIALMEANGQTGDVNSKTHAKIVLWDTTSQNINSISNDEFPDQFISGLLNVNGTVYIFSGNIDTFGIRVSRYVGGNSIEEVIFLEDGTPPYQGAVCNNDGQILFGSSCTTPTTAASVYSIGLHKPSVTNGLFNIARVSNTSAITVSAVAAPVGRNFNITFPWIGWTTGTTGGTNNGVDVPYISSYDYSSSNQVWWSQEYRIGTPFKLRRIRIPLAQTLTSSMSIVPSIWIDDTGQRTLTTINSANYGASTQLITLNIPPTSVPVGDHSFRIELKWTGSALCVVSLPITVEYELLDVETAYP